uniref:Uncharacterized protein n=1 Tax=Periophthalmus magnuspinnatus TaxID=409849 RepID=A0A3B4B7E5_9GOBI
LIILILFYFVLILVSDIVLVCGSDRSIQMFDMNRGAVAAELPDAHSRAVHCITQNKGSLFSVQASDSYNLFLTSAVTDGIKIWDLRSLRCVRRYENHVNRCHSCSCALSPCGRYIATGSEDNCAYVYDVRSSSYLHKLHKESSPVLSVVFNPSTPEVTQTLHLVCGFKQCRTEHYAACRLFQGESLLLSTFDKDKYSIKPIGFE